MQPGTMIGGGGSDGWVRVRGRIGAHGKKIRSSCSQRSTMLSDDRSETLYRFCTDTTGVRVMALRKSCSDTFETPIWRTLPSFFSCRRAAPTDSSYGTLGIRAVQLVQRDLVDVATAADSPRRLRAGTRAGRRAPIGRARPGETAFRGDDQVVGIWEEPSAMSSSLTFGP